jgi:hypothetical protein
MDHTEHVPAGGTPRAHADSPAAVELVETTADARPVVENLALLRFVAGRWDGHGGLGYTWCFDSREPGSDS